MFSSGMSNLERHTRAQKSPRFCIGRKKLQFVWGRPELRPRTIKASGEAQHHRKPEARRQNFVPNSKRVGYSLAG